MRSCKLRSCDYPEASAKMRNSVDSRKCPPMLVPLSVLCNHLNNNTIRKSSSENF